MADPVTTVRNLGPAVGSACHRAGIRSAEELRGLQGRPWNDCQGAEKEALRRGFDAIKADASPRPVSELDRTLDAIGVIEQKRE